MTVDGEPARRVRRIPLRVIAAGIVLLFTGGLTILYGILFLLARWATRVMFDSPRGQEPATLREPFTGAFDLVVLLLVVFGAIQILVAVKAVGGRTWARFWGIGLAALGVGVVVYVMDDITGWSAALLAAFCFVAYALASGGVWFESQGG